MRLNEILKPDTSWINNSTVKGALFKNKSDLMIIIAETIFFSGGRVMILRDGETTNLFSYKKLEKNNQVQVKNSDLLKLKKFYFN